MTFQCEQCEACFPFFNGRMCPECGNYRRTDWVPQTSGPSRSQIGVPSQPYQGPMPPMMGAGSLFGQPPGYVNPHPIHPPRLPPQVNELESSEPSEDEEIQRFVDDMLAKFDLGPKAAGPKPVATSPSAADSAAKSKSSPEPKEDSLAVDPNTGKDAAKVLETGLFDPRAFPILPKLDKPVMGPPPSYASASGAGNAAASPARDPHKAYPPKVKCSKQYP